MFCNLGKSLVCERRLCPTIEYETNLINFNQVAESKTQIYHRGVWAARIWQGAGAA